MAGQEPHGGKVSTYTVGSKQFEVKDTGAHKGRTAGGYDLSSWDEGGAFTNKEDDNYRIQTGECSAATT